MHWFLFVLSVQISVIPFLHLKIDYCRMVLCKVLLLDGTDYDTETDVSILLFFFILILWILNHHLWFMHECFYYGLLCYCRNSELMFWAWIIHMIFRDSLLNVFGFCHVFHVYLQHRGSKLVDAAIKDVLLKWHLLHRITSVVPQSSWNSYTQSDLVHQLPWQAVHRVI